MKQNFVYIDDLHFDLKRWLNELRFYKDELDIFKYRLEEIAARNTGHDVTAQIEHFQNRFIREGEVNDELRHEIKQHENRLFDRAIANPIAVDHVRFEDHNGLREQIDTYHKLYSELKHEYVNFLAEWM
ncbi:MAG: hypothetical protein R2798_05260 [Chitinophagales bacterium]|nr:hypothetical protein [Bacteroidota bacterium]MCB9042674.1 hypothetical protein [Chitinophagales bacterium]